MSNNISVLFDATSTWYNEFEFELVDGDWKMPCNDDELPTVDEEIFLKKFNDPNEIDQRDELVIEVIFPSRFIEKMKNVFIVSSS